MTAAPTSSGERRPGELTFLELLRWGWRQLTSMRTALVLLLLLALAAVPGSVVPQEGVDALNASQWKEDHPTLAPIYERLGLFDVYSSPWFAAIYLLLMISLVGCIIPRTRVYWRALRAQPPAAPRNLTRLPDSASYVTDESPEVVLERARAALRRRRYRIRPSSEAAGAGDDAVSAERGYLREAGNLLFHLSLLVVLAGFAAGSLLGYQGGVILVQGHTFGNTLTQYDDFAPGGAFRTDQLDDFCFAIDDFDVEWLDSGPNQGMARGFAADMRYSAPCPRGGLGEAAEPDRYDLRVNHPLSIGDTELFLIGHGYAPVVTVRDGNGDVAYSGPTVFLPQDQNFLSFGVIKVPDALPQQLGFDGLLYPTYVGIDQDGDGVTDPTNVMGDLRNPLLTMRVLTGDLGMDTGASQSVYVLDQAGLEPVVDGEGKPARLDLSVGETATLPDGLGTVTFEGIERWQRLQISQTPGKLVALGGVVLALVGLLGSLFVRPRRIWVRAVRTEDGTLVHVAALDRSGSSDLEQVPSDALENLLTDLKEKP